MNTISNDGGFEKRSRDAELEEKLAYWEDDGGATNWSQVFVAWFNPEVGDGQ